MQEKNISDFSFEGQDISKQSAKRTAVHPWNKQVLDC